MAANAQELALRYLLALSSDVRVALLLSEGGELLASAPAPVGEAASADASQLVGEALGFRNGDAEPIELDILGSSDMVFLLADRGLALICVAERLALPGIILHEMRAVLADLTTGSRGTLRKESA